MAEEIGSLRTVFTAETAQYEDGMKRSENVAVKTCAAIVASFGKFQSAANFAIDRIFSFKSAMVGLATGAVVGAMKNVLDGIGNIADSARDLGLTAEAYQEISFAAALAGIDAEKFNTGMAKLLKNVGEALTGNKQAADSFVNLGVKIRDSAGNARSTEEIFTDVMRALGNIPDPAVRAADAVDFFGKAATRFAGFAGEGVDQMEAMRKKAQDLGLILSNETVAAAEEAGDKLDTAGQIIRMNLNVALAELVPLLAKVSEAFSDPEFIDFLARLRWAVGDTIKDIRELYAAINEGGTTKRNAADLLPKFITSEKPQRKERKLSDLLPDFMRPDETQQQAAAAPAKPVVAKKPDTPAAKNTIAPKIIDYVANKKALADVETVARQRLQNTKTDDAEMERVLEQLDREKESRRELINSVSMENAELQELNAAYASGGVGIEEIRAKYQMINDAKRLNIDLSSAEGEEFTKQVNKNVELGKQLEENQDRWRELQMAGQNAGYAITDSLEGMLNGTLSLSDGLKGLANDLIKIATRSLILDPIAKSLGGAITTGLFSLGGAGAGAGAGSIMPTRSFSGANARGGAIFPGGSYLVGENGPERFVPSVRGDIVPNDQLGGGGNTYQIDARGADAATVQRLERVIAATLGPGKLEYRVRDAMMRGKI